MLYEYKPVVNTNILQEEPKYFNGTIIEVVLYNEVVKKIKYLHQYVQHVRPRLVPGDSELILLCREGNRLRRSISL